jgi:hypothetical protein
MTDPNFEGIPPPPPAAPPLASHLIREDHPQATTSLVLGIISLVLCQLVAPIALVLGRRAVREIDASGGMLGGRGQAQAGWIMGLIGTILLAVSVLVILAVVVFAAVGSST